MSQQPLPNYLRSHRLREDLYQREVGFLLGETDGARVSRHELADNLPDLKTAFAYEVIYGIPLSELFRGEFEKVEKEIAKRAKRLAQVVEREIPRLGEISGSDGRL